MKAYNRSGDIIHTSLYGGETIAKDSLIVEAYGTIDELNTLTGLARAKIGDGDIKNVLKGIQEDLLSVGSDLAAPLDKEPPVQRISKNKITELESIIESYDKELPQINRFVVPNGSVEASMLHIARSVARRAERRLITLKKERQINENIPMYINRLSDLLFVLARLMNKRKGINDELWTR
jgi:cob(I)alamin adenosyltransferase